MNWWKDSKYHISELSNEDWALEYLSYNPETQEYAIIHKCHGVTTLLLTFKDGKVLEEGNPCALLRAELDKVNRAKSRWQI